MAIDFTLSPEQKKVQMDTRDFAESVLAPAVRDADAEPDPSPTGDGCARPPMGSTMWSRN
jgi:hypothetical protein